MIHSNSNSIPIQASLPPHRPHVVLDSHLRQPLGDGDGVYMEEGRSDRERAKLMDRIRLARPLVLEGS